MVKETIKFMDGTEKEFEFNRLGFRKAMQIAKSHIPIRDLTINKETEDITIKGDVDLFGMSISCLETIEGLDLDFIDSTEAKRVYSKHFEKDVMVGLGQGGNPN